MPNRFFAWGAIAAGLGVVFGAFGAHALADRITPERLDVFKTGVQYQLIHALALLAVGWAATRWPGGWTRAAGRLFALGIVVFSGSLYLLVLTGRGWLGAITPVGGVAFIAGWAALAVAALRSPDVPD